MDNVQPKSWQRATKFREHLSFISTGSTLNNNNSNLKSSFSPVTPPPMPEIPPPAPARAPSWVKTGQTIDLERGFVPPPSPGPTVQTPQRKNFSSRFSFWRATSTGNHPPSSPVQLTPWRALSIRKNPPPPPPLIFETKCCHHHDGKKPKRSSRKWLILLIIVLILLLADAIFLNVRTLQPVNVVSGTVSISSTSSAPSKTSTSTAPATSTAAPSQALLDCLSQFKLNAPSDPNSYPCGTCAQIMSGVPNDLSPATTKPQTTGQGAALQFCALRDIAQATSNSTLQNVGWLKDVNYCGWNGISCDSAGRVNSMTLVFPGVPATLPASLSSLVGLQTLQITGDSNVPAGAIQSGGVLSLPSLQSIHLESTALTGPIPDDTFANSQNLTSVTFARNAHLGQTLPASLFTLSLSSLIVNSQSLSFPLTSVTASSSLPSSLQTLDLSSNSFSTSIPDFSSFSKLVELHLDTNSLSGSMPSAFPGALKALTLASNPQLGGSVPGAVCSSTQLTTCDMRGTQIGVNGGNASTGSCGPCQFGS